MRTEFFGLFLPKMWPPLLSVAHMAVSHCTNHVRSCSVFGNCASHSKPTTRSKVREPKEEKLGRMEESQVQIRFVTKDYLINIKKTRELADVPLFKKKNPVVASKGFFPFGGALIRRE